MYLINVIVSENGYKDRFRFFLELDDKVTRQIIYVRNFKTILPLKNTIIRTPPPHYAAGIKFWIWAAKDIFRTIRTDPNKWIIVEHLNALVLFLIKLSSPLIKNRPVLVYGIYAENIFYLREKVWQKDGKSIVNFKQNYYYYRRWYLYVLKDLFYLYSADAIISNSQRMIDFINQKFKNKKTFRILNTTFSLGEINVERETVKKNIDILYVGNITPAKGIYHFFSALKTLEDEKLNVVMIGKVIEPDRQWFQKSNELFWK